MDQVVYESHSSVTIFIKLSYKLYWNIGILYQSLVSIFNNLQNYKELMLYQPWSHWTRGRARHNFKLQSLSNSKTASNSCCINLGHTGPDGVQVTIISYNIYQTQKPLVPHVVLTLVSLDQMTCKSYSSVTLCVVRILTNQPVPLHWPGIRVKIQTTK